MTDGEPFESLDAETVVAINEIECAEAGAASVLLDAGGLEAAVARPWSGYGDHELFPTIFDKAAALLEAIASRQVFQDGNKRTAWVAARTLLELNGVDLGDVEPIQAEAVVRAAGVDHTFGAEGVADWLRVTARQAGSSANVGQTGEPRILIGTSQGQSEEHVAGVKRYYRQMDVLLELTNEQLEAGRAAAHEALTDITSRLGSVQPNEVVDNDQQAADYAAQDDGTAVTLMLTRAMHWGLPEVLPEGGQLRDIIFRALPDDYQPPDGYQPQPI